jgi:hypothetical protein
MRWGPEGTCGDVLLMISPKVVRKVPKNDWWRILNTPVPNVQEIFLFEPNYSEKRNFNVFQ